MAKKGNIVKRTKSNVNLLIIVLMAVGWLCAVSFLLNDDDEQAQAALVQQAEVFVEDQLYIRAVGNYKQAIANYETDKNYEYETRLLELYLEAEMLTEYYELLETRVAAGTAQEQEYIILAEAYIQAQNYSKAITVLKGGIDRFANEEMVQMKEQIIYLSSVRTLSVAELRQATASKMVPVFNGTLWGYASTGGSLILDCIYEEVTRFEDSFAVVKLDGAYTLIDASGYWYAVDKVGIDQVTDISAAGIVGVKDGKYQIYSRTFQLLSQEAYDYIYMNDNGLYVVQKDGMWAILSAELEPITDYIFTDVAVNSQGRVFSGNYAMVKDAGGYFMVDTAGNALYETRFADAKGFEGGICAVADASGKWGFANGSGEMIVNYQYEDAYGFSDNLGAVKDSGKWGYINRYNTMIMEPQYEQVYPFVGGTALVKTNLGTYDIITLKFYDQF